VTVTGSWPRSLVVGHVEERAGNRNRAHVFMRTFIGFKRFVQTPRAVDLLMEKAVLGPGVGSSSEVSFFVYHRGVLT